MTCETPIYPGDLASADQILKLAEEYRGAALHLVELGKPGAPFRLLAIHSIELYLNAMLRHLGHPPESVRGLQHDLRRRVEVVREAGLPLRTGTLEHLLSLTQNREYLIVRYGPEIVIKTSEVTRVTASLNEVANKVSVRLRQAAKVAAAK